MSTPQDDTPWWLPWSLRIAATRPGAWLLSRTLPRVDRVLKRVSDGRLSIPRISAMAGAPIVRLTTTGAKTGRERTVPVLGIRDGEGWIVVASNWGRPEHPAWYHNLRANPEVELTHAGRTSTYVAREATGEQRAECWRRARAVNPGLDTYQERAGDRDIPIVVLEPPGDDRPQEG